MTAPSSSLPLPAWAQSIRRKYLSGESSVFLLHLNVFDQIYHGGKNYSLPEFLSQHLLWDNKDNILHYDPGAGLTVLKEKSKAVLGAKPLPNRSPKDVLTSLEDVLFNMDHTAVIVSYAGTIIPAGTMGMMGEQDRLNVVTFHRWSLSSKLLDKDSVVFLITESVPEVNSKVVSNPRVAAIEIPMPDADVRREVIKLSDPGMNENQVEQFVKHTAGLRAVQISSLLTPTTGDELQDSERMAFIKELIGDSKDAETRAQKLASLTQGMNRDEIRHLINPEAKQAEPVEDLYKEVIELVHVRKREIIEKECQGLIEFIDSSHDFSAVGGNEGIKKELMQIAENIKNGNTARVPMGLLFVGPMGSGKTFVAGAFAKASGLTAIKLKNFRSKWVGSTESNLEKVLSMVGALGPILVIIDEGDRAFGSGGEGDGGTSSRVMARLKEFMSDTDNRGKVLFVLMTNRPDKIDVDMKRAGRLDRKIPFFYPYETDEVEMILGAIMRRHKVKGGVDFETGRSTTSAKLVGYSIADLEAVALLAHDIAESAGIPVDNTVFETAVNDYMPPRDTHMLEYMEMLAVFEASRRSMLPAKYRDVTADDLNERLFAKRRVLGI